MKDLELKKLFPIEIDDESAFDPNTDEEFITDSLVDWIYDKDPAGVEDGDEVIDSKVDITECSPDDEYQIPNKSDYSDNNLGQLIEKYKKQQQLFVTHQKELQTDFAGWKKNAGIDHEKQNSEMQTKQEYLSKLEENNKKLENDLKLKLQEYEEQTIKLMDERKQLNVQEMELERKSKECDKRSKNYFEKLKEIESQSMLIEAQRAELTRGQEKFAGQIKEFKRKVSMDDSTEFNQELLESREELQNEWAALHAERTK